MLGEISAQSRSETSDDDWLASLCDALMSDYGLSLHDAVWRFPLEAAAALAPARIRRHGGKWDKPDSHDRAISAARARCKAWLAENFTLLSKDEAGPDDALGDWMRARRSP